MFGLNIRFNGIGYFALSNEPLPLMSYVDECIWVDHTAYTPIVVEILLTL